MKSIACRLLLLLVPASIPASLAHGEPPTYERDVRPILKAHCFQCHGEDETVEGGLDLRLRRFMVRGGESGGAIQPGSPEQSLLLQRVVSGEMPPDDKQLAADEIERIRRWIEAGAATERPEPETLDEASYFTSAELGFWAFQPVRRPPVPQAAPHAQLRTPIDVWIGQRLGEEGLEFSPSAARQTLIRRLYFDLLGVPPSPAAVEAFLADEQPAAYERLVDRLLASPQYGERWGRHWLDVAGYADSEGYVDADPQREWAYGYRDYVIRAFNAGMPFDQFVVEQLAGDELVHPPYADLAADDIRRLTATGFLRMAPDGTGAGGVDQDAARNEVIAGTIEIMSTSLLGLTVGCARCHNHRYDPISQRDYYALRAVLAPALDWKSWRAPAARRISLYTARDRQVKAAISQRVQQAEQERQKILTAHLKRTLYEELIKAPDDVRDTLRAAYETAGAQRSPAQVALLKEYPNIQNISSGSLYLYSQQRARRANEIAAVADRKEQALIARASAASPGGAVTAETLDQFDPDGAALVAEYRQAAEVCRQTDSQKQLADLQQGIDDIRATIPLERFVRALTEPPDHTPQTVLFKRGNHDQPGAAVAPGELAIVDRTTPVAILEDDDALPTTGRRLAYARHLTSGEHPLLARVMVNRVWLHHFGRGIVNSPGDFGQLGERPSHPELLDWLASELVDSGWQLKRLHRLILTSHAYRQSSARTAQLDQVDPDNRLYARQSVRRLEAEALRDAVLTVSGLYQPTMYGPPIPVREDSVGQIVLGKEDLDGERKPRADAGLGAAEHRRSLYVQVRRSRPLAVLETFDIAAVTPNCTQRPSSNVAPQSLLMMNSDFIVRYARALADRVQREAGGEPTSQVRRAWLLAYAEPPSETTLAALCEFLERQTTTFRRGNDKLDEASARQQALSVLCQALMGANQFLYVD